MQTCKLFTLLLLLTAGPLLAAVPTGATPLRVDINSEGRADMRTIGWENWRPSGGDMSQSFGELNITLRAGDGGSVKLVGKKALVVDGVTLGADGVVATGGKPVVMEMQFEGLEPGPHTFVGYHHALGGTADAYTVSTGDCEVRSINPSKNPHHNDEVGTSFIKFEAKTGQPVVIRIIALRGEQVILNGFALDVSNPRLKALKPIPADYERHANGDNGQVTLAWTHSGSAVRHHVYLVSDRDPNVAERKLAAATMMASIDGNSISVSKDSRLHYAWRVDSEDSQGKITTGDIWHFRVRHLALPTAEGYGRFAIGDGLVHRGEVVGLVDGIFWHAADRIGISCTIQVEVGDDAGIYALYLGKLKHKTRAKLARADDADPDGLALLHTPSEQ